MIDRAITQLQHADLDAYVRQQAETNVGEFGRALRKLKKALWRAKEGQR